MRRPYALPVNGAPNDVVQVADLVVFESLSEESQGGSRFHGEPAPLRELREPPQQTLTALLYRRRIQAG